MTTVPVSTAPASTTAPDTTVSAPTTARDQTFGILSLVVSIVSVVSGFIPVGSVVAIILGGVALQREPASRKLATAGIIIGAIPVAISVGMLTLLPFGLLSAIGVGALGFGWF